MCKKYFLGRSSQQVSLDMSRHLVHCTNTASAGGEQLLRLTHPPKEMFVLCNPQISPDLEPGMENATGKMRAGAL